ncbi:MAG: hypothetical protein ACD_9C00254G0017 [uncultured bacterium]|nr:MAG: hypothetical protein ACD_9C00254G0017 [uncultured bacterium]
MSYNGAIIAGNPIDAAKILQIENLVRKTMMEHDPDAKYHVHVFSDILPSSTHFRNFYVEHSSMVAHLDPMVARFTIQDFADHIQRIIVSSKFFIKFVISSKKFSAIIEMRSLEQRGRNMVLLWVQSSHSTGKKISFSIFQNIKKGLSDIFPGKFKLQKETHGEASQLLDQITWDPDMEDDHI